VNYDFADQIQDLLTNNTVQTQVIRENKTHNIVYTAPSPGTYDQQWFWDSCLHSLVWSELGENNRAVQEIESLVIGKGNKDFIPHMIFWKKIKNVTWWIFDHLYPTDLFSELIQPPLIGYSIQQLMEKGMEFSKEVIPNIVEHYHHISEVRDPEKKGLITIIHPWESGLDSSPKFDLELTNKRRMRFHQWIRMRSILKESSSYGWNQSTMSRKCSFRVKCVLTNTLHSMGLMSLSKALHKLNLKETASELEQKAKDVVESLIENSWNEKDGLFYDLNMNQKSNNKIRISTITSLIPLMLDIPKDIKDRLLNHLTDEKEYWPAYPIPTVSMKEPSFNPKNIQLLWRGPTWVNTNFFIWKGLRKHKENKIADELVSRTRSLISKSGFREFFNPITGEGGGAKNFGWSTLVLLMKKNSN
jgi:hypothetical protein